MQTDDTLTLAHRELRLLVGKLARDPGTAFFVPPIPDDPPAPAGEFHTLPEVFIQIGGFTDFALPWMEFRINPNQACIIPAYCRHEERYGREGKPFHCLVGMVGHADISWHQGRFDKAGRFYSTDPVFCHVRQIDRLIRLLSETSRCGSQGEPYGRVQVRGSALLSFSALLAAMTTSGDPPTEHPKITFCKHYIQTHLDDASLCVKTLARHARCSPNYLSGLFRAHTGRRITDFVNERRLERVRDLLMHSSLNISEIAVACGYADPGYMARLFVKSSRQTPSQFRTNYHLDSPEIPGHGSR